LFNEAEGLASGAQWMLAGSAVAFVGGLVAASAATWAGFSQPEDPLE